MKIKSSKIALQRLKHDLARTKVPALGVNYAGIDAEREKLRRRLGISKKEWKKVIR